MFKKMTLVASMVLFAMACQRQPKQVTIEPSPKATYELLGYDSKEAWGEHLVMICGCEDCHSPKKMTPMGPVPDPALRLSGHNPAYLTANLDRPAIEKNGLAACNPHMTAWTGPWGISYAGNLTPDATGIGNWPEENFFRAIREGKFKGLANGRTLLPPMPWQGFAHMSDDEISAIFAYLKSIPAVKNVVPSPDPPLVALK